MYHLRTSHYDFRVVLGALALIIILAVNTMVSLSATRALISRVERVEHTRLATQELDATLIAMLNAETGERGYLYTGDRRFLEPYELGASQVDAHLARLDSLTADNPRQQQNLVRLRSLVEEKKALIARVLKLVRAGQHEAARELVEGGKVAMDRFRELLNQMRSEEVNLLVQQSSEAARSERYLLLMLPVSAVLTGTLIITGVVLVTRDLRRRSESLALLREFAQRERAARLEIEAAQGRAEQAQQALIRSEKLAAVGRMAATVAHEINNPLEAVTNLIWIIGRDPGIGVETRRNLDLADEELRRVAHIAKQTLAFYRDSSSPVTVDLQEILSGVIGLYSSRLNSREVLVQHNLRHCTIRGYAGELRQLFSNLLVNAIDAMNKGGRLSVKLAPGRAWKDGEVEGARVTIADNGSGINSEHMARLFEPFFTTKARTGTGLGLWVAKQIIEKHSGVISLRSSTRATLHYTVVSVFLPRDEEIS